MLHVGATAPPGIYRTTGPRKAAFWRFATVNSIFAAMRGNQKWDGAYRKTAWGEPPERGRT